MEATEAESPAKDPAVAEDTDADRGIKARAGAANVARADTVYVAVSCGAVYATAGAAIVAMTGAV